MRTADVKDQIELTGNDINAVSLTAANIQQTTEDVTHDIRKFLDGIYVSWKGNAEVDVAYACVVAVFLSSYDGPQVRSRDTAALTHNTQHAACGGAGARARARARVVGLWVHTPTRTCGVGRSVWEYVKFGL